MPDHESIQDDRINGIAERLARLEERYLSLAERSVRAEEKTERRLTSIETKVSNLTSLSDRWKLGLTLAFLIGAAIGTAIEYGEKIWRLVRGS